MRIYIQRPWFAIHSNYPSVGIIRVRCFGKATPENRECIDLEIWASGDPSTGTDSWMENGVIASLTPERAEELRDMLTEAINKARGIKTLEGME